MKAVLSSLNVNSYEIEQNVILNILNIEEINDTVKNYIDEVLIDIYSKGQDTNIEIVKIKLRKYFVSKKVNLEIGSIAEFFVHLYLKMKNFEQECLYKNLEENSIKKGFDGFYSKDNETWIMESKSGNIASKEISHNDKIKEAYNDLKGKFLGKSTNNPWENAYNHAIQARSNKDILLQIKNLEDKYTLGEYTEIKEYNIIPSSTIFYDSSEFECINYDDLKEDISTFLRNKTYKRIEFVCINKKTKNLFLDYINS